MDQTRACSKSFFLAVKPVTPVLFISFNNFYIAPRSQIEEAQDPDLFESLRVAKVVLLSSSTQF